MRCAATADATDTAARPSNGTVTATGNHATPSSSRSTPSRRKPASSTLREVDDATAARSPVLRSNPAHVRNPVVPPLCQVTVRSPVADGWVLVIQP